MGDITWIKLATGLPDDKKIKQIRRLQNGDTIALLWVFLICLAGETNDNGMVYITPEEPFTVESLAEHFRMEEDTVDRALQAFQRYGMIEIVNDIICLTAWEKWQAVDSLATIREQTRKRVAKHRAKQKAVADGVTDNGDVTQCNVTSNGDVTQCNATEEDIEEEKEIDKDIKDIIPDSDEPESPAPKKTKSSKPVKHKYGVYQHVLLTDNERKKLVDDFGPKMIEDAVKFLDEYIEEKSYKSKSHNLAIRRWVIDAVKEKEQKQNKGRKEMVPSWMNKNRFNNFPQREIEDVDEYEKMLLSTNTISSQKTAANDEEIRRRAEALKQQFGGA